jgi:hypothetical protein
MLTYVKVMRRTNECDYASVKRQRVALQDVSHVVNLQHLSTGRQVCTLPSRLGCLLVSKLQLLTLLGSQGAPQELAESRSVAAAADQPPKRDQPGTDRGCCDTTGNSANVPARLLL